MISINPQLKALCKDLEDAEDSRRHWKHHMEVSGKIEKEYLELLQCLEKELESFLQNNIKQE